MYNFRRSQDSRGRGTSNRQRRSDEPFNIFGGELPFGGLGEESLYGASWGRGPSLGAWGGGPSFGAWSMRDFRSRSPEREPEPPSPPQWFKLSDSCLLCLQRGDITEWLVDTKSDAIVNAANEMMLGGGGVDGAIHRAAGPDLYKACKAFPEVERGVRCPTGEAKITPGFRLPAHAIIHTVGPIYHGKRRSEPDLIASYKNSILLAAENNIQYLAFPAISCGIYGYPYDDGALTALQTCQEQADKLKEIHFVLFERPAWTAWLKAAEKLQLPGATIDEDARKDSKQQAEKEWRDRVERERTEEEDLERERMEKLRNARGGRFGRQGAPWKDGSRMYGKEKDMRGPGTYVHSENVDKKLAGRRDYSRLHENRRDDYVNQDFGGLKTEIQEDYFKNDEPSEGTEKESSANSMFDWDVEDSTGWTPSKPTEEASLAEDEMVSEEASPAEDKTASKEASLTGDKLASQQAAPDNEAQSVIQIEKESQGDEETAPDLKDSRGSGFEEKVPSSSGSFRTGKEEFEDDTNGEESEGNAFKRLRSKEGQAEEEVGNAEEKSIDDSDGSQKKLKEGAQEVSEEAKDSVKQDAAMAVDDHATDP